MKKRIVITVLALFVVCVGVLHINYPLPYVIRVMVDQGPDYDDFETSPASVISPADVASRLPYEPDADGPVTATVLSHWPEGARDGYFLLLASPEVPEAETEALPTE